MHYKPLDWQIPVWTDTNSRVILLAGAAGGGKSRVAAEKIHGYLQKYPGATALVVRKTFASMKNSTLLFLQNEVIGLQAGVKHNKSDHRFEYPNGSVLAYGGMYTEQQRESIRGVGSAGGLDIVWMEEATQFDESDYDELLFRLRGRAAPWRQIILSTNPDGPLHWINLRLILGRGATLYESRFDDNFYNPTDYRETMEQSTGVERKRLFEGQWAKGGQLTYDMWRDGGPESHVTENADYIAGVGSVYWGVDDGYVGEIDERSGMFKAGSHPRVFLLSQMRSGKLNIFAESYRIEAKAARQIAGVVEMGYPDPEFVVVDRSAAALKGELHVGEWGDLSWQFYTRNSPPRVDESVKVVREWLSSDKNGFTRVAVHPRCTFLRGEMSSYTWDPVKDKPVKEFDHGPDCLRSLVWALRVM